MSYFNVIYKSTLFFILCPSGESEGPAKEPHQPPQDLAFRLIVAPRVCGRTSKHNWIWAVKSSTGIYLNIYVFKYWHMSCIYKYC